VDWDGDPEGAKSSVQRWGNVEEYLSDRHGLLPAPQNGQDVQEYLDSYFGHPATFAAAKLHSLAQARPHVDGYGPGGERDNRFEDYLLSDDDLTQGAALGLLKIRRNNKTKQLEPHVCTGCGNLNLPPPDKKGNSECQDCFYQNHTAAKLIVAALNEETIGKLHSEFRDWWRSGDGPAAFNSHPLIVWCRKQNQESYRRIQNEMKRRGPIGWWPNVENFLKQKYPAAHKNFEAGLEDAVFWLDKGGVYDTGQDSISQHGYDPREIAAGMVFLHNESHPFRGDMAQKDQQRLTDIYNKRVQMQEEYNQKQLVSASYYGH
jgi:hypothetical protein